MKISIIGAGQVGATAALRIAEKELAKEVILVDIVSGLAKGKALDMSQAAHIEGHDVKIKGTENFEEIKDSNIVICTAGLTRKPGMSREDLLEKNVEIVKSVCENIKNYAPNSILIMVTNPLDIMSYLALKVTGFDKKKVIGMAGILDSARLGTFIAEELNISKKDVKPMVLGGHGDSMVALPEHTIINDKPLTELTTKEIIKKLNEKTKEGGAEIVKHLKTSAWYAPGSAVAKMVEVISKDSKEILPVSVYLNGEYGYKDIFLGVPVKLGKAGVEGIVELKLSEESKKSLDNSAEITRKNIENLSLD